MNTQGLIEEKAKVVLSADGFAEVETDRVTACGNCSAKAGCGTSLLAGVFGNRSSRMRVLNPIDAQPGQRVVIGLQPQVLVKASLVVYLIPLLSLILFAIMGEAVAGYLGMATPEPLSIVCGLTGLLAGLAWLRHFSRTSRVDSGYHAVILRIERSGRLAVNLPGPSMLK